MFFFVFCLESLWILIFFFFFSSRRRHTRLTCDWSSDVCSSDLIEGPIVLVGHSYGGAVITNVDREAGEIVGLVYVAAFAPLPGDSCFELSAVFPGRSEERRVGEEGRNRWAPWQLKKKRKKEGQG